MTFDELRAALAEQNPHALLCDGLEPALVSIATRCGQPALAVYSKRRAVEHLVNEGSEYNEAVEYLEHNTWGAWNGEHSPLWLEDLEEDNPFFGDVPTAQPLSREQRETIAALGERARREGDHEAADQAEALLTLDE